MTSQNTIVTERTFTRDEVASLLNGRTAPIRFEQCVFDGEDLSKLDLSACVFADCSAAETSFQRSQLQGSHWLGCKARSGDFSYADLADARFADSDLNNSSWRGSRLGSVVFERVKLTGAAFVDVKGLGLVFRESLLVGTDLRGMSFRKQRLFQVDFSNADLSGCDFRDAVFEGGSLRDAHLKNARFEGADLRQVQLGSLDPGIVRTFKLATISHEQAAELAHAMGMLVA